MYVPMKRRKKAAIGLNVSLFIISFKRADNWFWNASAATRPRIRAAMDMNSEMKPLKNPLMTKNKAKSRNIRSAIFILTPSSKV